MMVAQPTPTPKPTAYYCTYLGLSGVLTRPANQVLFLEPESGAVVTLSPEEVLRDVVINGVVSEAMAAYIDDMARGGAVGVCLTRRQEV